MNAIKWEDGAVIILDQRLLPLEEIYNKYTNYIQVADSIRNMEIRGAPAIGVATGMGIALAAKNISFEDADKFKKEMDQIFNIFAETRPTAVNLFWAIDRMKKIVESKSSIPELIKSLEEEAVKMYNEDIEINKKMGKNGSRFLDDGDIVLTHCNAGSLATVQYGTALAPVRSAIEQGKKISVIADETRPRLQGARLTAYELHYDKIPVKVISDTSSGLLMRLGKVNKVIVGTDRVTSDAVFNKIGTYLVALAAKDNDIPFYVAAPSSTLSLHETAKDVTIEQRDSTEVSNILGKVQIVPDGVECLNYAFDITPFRLVTGVITEDGVFSHKELLQKYE
ncbi:MAG: S-methyl-5-thioribose-1-phosphate isomerase [Actinomycetia bacterium]|nr:S-methyl-5-thioribose-1-phosphate isomerase [Actinomycetes bacterium]